MTVDRQKNTSPHLWPMALAAFTAVLLFAPQSAAAHGVTRSYSTWESKEDGVRVTVRVPRLEFQRLLPVAQFWAPPAVEANPAFARAVSTYLREHFTLYAGKARCASSAAYRLFSVDPAYLVLTWDLTCPGPEARRVRVDLFFDAAPDHLHFVKLMMGGATRQAVLTSERREVELQFGAAVSIGLQALRFTRLGVEHVLTGVDHLVFLLALLLLGGSLGWMARVVTGFTVAHSLTLALSVMGVVRPPPAAVEALVGLSIAYVAIENLWLTGGPGTRRTILAALVLVQAVFVAGAISGLVALPLVVAVGVGLFIFSYLPLLEQVPEAGRLRWMVAFLFGLVHGFAFAGFLLELDLPAETLAVALAGFNIGVEGSQLLVIATTWPVIALMHRGQIASRYGVWLVRAGSAGALLLGAFWFVTRAVSG